MITPSKKHKSTSIIFVLFLQSIFYLSSSLFAQIEPGQTGEVTIVKTNITGTVLLVSVGDPINEDAQYIESNTSGTWTQEGSTLTIKFDVTLTMDAPIGEIIHPWFMVLISSSSGISNLPEPVSITVIEPEEVKADFSGTPTEGTVPLTVEFSDHSTGEITTHAWDFGDGNTSSEQNPAHTYLSPGTYSVSLIAAGLKGEDTITKENYISVLPIEAEFSASPTEGTVPLSVVFADNSIGIINSWLWDFGDGNTSIEQNPTHIYQTSGEYSVYLKVSNSSMADSLIKSDYIKVEPFHAEFSYTISPEDPLRLLFKDESSGNITSWSWDFGNGGAEITIQDPERLYPWPGIYLVTLKVSNESQNSTVQKEIYVYGDASWIFKTEDNITSPPAIGENGVIYFVQGEYIYAVNQNGTFKWKYKIGISYGISPAIGNDGTIYFGGSDQYFYAFKDDGTLKWKYETDDLISTSPAISSDGYIYIAAKYLYALNPDGSVKWKYLLDEINTNKHSPVIGRDGIIYIGGSNDLNFYAFNPDGSIKWKYQTGNGMGRYSAVGRDGTVYIDINDHIDGYNKPHLYAFNPDGTVKWKYEVADVMQEPVIGADGTIYLCDGSCFYAFNSDGSIKWKYENEVFYGSIRAIDDNGVIYLQGNNSLIAFNADGTIEREYNIIGVDRPTIDSNGLLYTSIANFLYAINTQSNGLEESSWPCSRGNSRRTGNVESNVNTTSFTIRGDELKCYPNPANEVITIETDNSRRYIFEITSLNGQQILLGELEGTFHQIDFSSFQKGVYFITIRSNDFIATKKIIKL